MARDAGADLAVGGRITSVIFGGTAGQTSVAVEIEIHDALTGEMLWSMSHSGQMTAGMSSDWILFTRKNRLPQSPEHAIMTALASDLAGPVRLWNLGPDEERKPAPAAVGAP
jgi:hypothetical protein